MGLEHFADQIPGQVHVALAHRQHWPQVGRPYRTEQVKHRALLQEAGGETGKRPEQQRRLTVDDPGVQVRNRHGRRANRRLAVNLGMMGFDHIRLLAHQPLATDRETTVTTGFVNTGLLQQRQRATTGTQEYKTGFQLGQLAGFLVLHPDFPAAVVTLVDVVHRAAQHQFEVGLGFQPLHHAAGQ